MKKDNKNFSISFGEPVPVLDNSLAYQGVMLAMGGQYYNPPINIEALARLEGANSYHGQALRFKADSLSKYFIESRYLSQIDIKKAAFDFSLSDNCYFQKIYNKIGRLVKLKHLPAVYMRRAATNINNPLGRADDYYVMLQHQVGIINGHVKFQPDEVLHLKGYDPLQGIYGKASYMGGVQDVLLSESSTLFRRKYYINGANLGYIMVTTDAGISEETAALLEDKIKGGKGAGNFKSLYINIKKTNSRNPVQIIPINDSNLNDSFTAIKQSTEMQIVAMHGIPPILLNIIPGNVGGLGDPEKALRIFYELKIKSMQQKFLEINDLTGLNIVKFKAPEWAL